MKQVLLAVAITGWGIASCSKSAGEKDNQRPVVTITSPANGALFSVGQVITIAGTATDNDHIVEMHIHVSNTNTGTLLMDVHLYPAGPNAVFNQPLTAAAGVNYRIQVLAKDRSANETISSVEVSCN